MSQKPLILAILAILIAPIANYKLLFGSEVKPGDRTELSADIVRWDQLIAPEEQQAKVSLSAAYVVGGVKLEPGKYLVIHQKFPATDEEVASFIRLQERFGPAAVARVRCTAMEGTRVRKFTIKTTTKPDGTLFVHSIQFPGSTEVLVFERGEIYLGHTYSVGGVPLERGKYLVLYRGEGNHQSDPCIFIYRLPYHPGQEAVAKVRCTPKEGQPAMEGVIIKSTIQPDGISLVRSIQFTGSTEVHNFESSN